MNAKQLIATLFTVAAGAAFAQGPAAGLSRAEVTAEYLRARAAGELSQGETDYPKMPPFASTKTRAEVLAELAAARANGEIPMSEADYDFAQTRRNTFRSPN